MKLSCEGLHLSGHRLMTATGQPRDFGHGDSFPPSAGCSEVRPRRARLRRAPRGGGGGFSSASAAVGGTNGPAPRLTAPRRCSAAVPLPPRRGKGEVVWRRNRPPPQRRFPLPLFLPSPRRRLPPGAARARGALPAGSAAALPVRASSNGSAPAGPRRPISGRLVPLPRSFSERIRRRSGKSYLCAPGPAALRAAPSPALSRLASPEPQPRRSPHARGRGLYLSYLGGWLRSWERGGRKAELPVALVLPSRAFTHTFTCTDLKVQFRQGDGGTGKRGESSLDQTCHKRRTSKWSQARRCSRCAGPAGPPGGLPSPRSGGGRGPAGTAFLLP